MARKDTASSPWGDFWSAFSQNRGAVGGLIVLLIIITLALFAELGAATTTPAHAEVAT